MAKTKEQKRLDNEAARLFKVHGDRTVFNIMDLGKINNELKAVVIAGVDVDARAKLVIAKYATN